MLRLCLTPPMAYMAAICIVGCRSASIEGAWVGALPVDGASDCRIRLMKGDRFDFTCRGEDGWTGIGTYAWDGRTLILRTAKALRRGQLAREWVPVISLPMRAEGNVLQGQRQHRSIRWERKAP